MISEQLLEILVCPETKQPLRFADQSELSRVNSEIASGRVQSRRGDKLTSPLEAALIREDGRYLYPIQGGIPIMLIEESIPNPTAV